MIPEQNKWQPPCECPSHSGYQAGEEASLSPTANWIASDCCNLEGKLFKSFLATEEVKPGSLASWMMLSLAHCEKKEALPPLVLSFKWFMLSFWWKGCWSLTLRDHKWTERRPCRKNWVSNIYRYRLVLGSNHQEFGWFPAPLLLGSEPDRQTQAPTVREFESQSQPPQSNDLSLKLLLLPRDCMKLKFPVSHRQAVSRSHYSPGHVSSMGKINKGKIQQKKLRKSQQNLHNFPYEFMTCDKISDT